MKPHLIIALVSALLGANCVTAQDRQNVTAGLTAVGAPLAIHGYDPVAYFTVGMPTRGSAKFTATHDGAAYRFASEENKEVFAKDPAAYLPQFGGFCAFGVTVSQKFDGDPRIFAIVEDKLYFNLNPDIEKMWSADIPANVRKAEDVWKTLHSASAHDALANDELNVTSSLTGASAPLAMHGYDPVAYFNVGMPTLGSAKFSATHGGAAYRFSSASNQAAFEREPSAYLPQFGGYCAYGVSVGKKFDGDPRVFALVDGKLYLNLNPDIQSVWNKDVTGNIKNADAQWPNIVGRRSAEL